MQFEYYEDNDMSQKAQDYRMKRLIKQERKEFIGEAGEWIITHGIVYAMIASIPISLVYHFISWIIN
ncbi:MAG: hypothetical protein B7Y23_02825 [Sulfurovum sp. 16-42-52]|jgi:hypothetical protein|nr:MAG: hypothetical protein B7Y23_02825 [Sulfurovum sp. 16-42-52]OZA46178.1 MAG: hypothetical protein B7X80_03255 [Sulfurovum sp. 17-42-90]